MNPDIPTGSSPEVVQAYFNYLYNIYLRQIDQTYYIHWATDAGILFWIVVLAVGLYLYTRWQRYTHNPEELYPVESYNGYIQETNGRVGPFLFIVFGVVVIWLIFLTADDLLNGQIC